MYFWQNSYKSIIVINFLKYFEISKNYEKLCKNHDHCEIKMSEKFKSIFNKDGNDFRQLPANIIKYTFLYKSKLYKNSEAKILKTFLKIKNILRLEGI